MLCNGCNPIAINGLLCHETGCPEAWRTRTRECRNCGSEFSPEEPLQTFCDEACWRSFNGFDNDEGEE
jgi:hypothetical protein